MKKPVRAALALACLLGCLNCPPLRSLVRPALALAGLLGGCTLPQRSPIDANLRPLPPRAQWTAERARAWSASKPWLVGCNFSPSTAINQLEMWQAATFDPVTIDRELGWAHKLGFNSARVFLHDQLWHQDAEGIIRRMDQFLGLAHNHQIGVVFVLLDGVWDPFPVLGSQRDPKPHVHNSGWVQSPGVEVLKDPKRHAELKDYIMGVVHRFRGDQRVDAWDLFNEPENLNRPAYAQFEPANKAELSLLLLRQVFAWAREANPLQPLTSGVWMGDWGDPEKLSPIELLQLDQSDIVSFHSYGKLEDLKKCVANLRRLNRPVLCTEFMARPQGSTFDPNLGYLKEQHVGAYCWGFVSGKTQTIYPWDSWTRTYDSEPKVWFHDIFRTDGTPFDPGEILYIKTVTGAGN